MASPVATALGRVSDDGKIRRRFDAALERAGLGHLRTKEEPFVFHDLRHVRDARRPGRAAHRRPGLAGPRQVQTTLIYVHYVPQHETADRVNRPFAPAQADAMPALVP